MLCEQCGRESQTIYKEYISEWMAFYSIDLLFVMLCLLLFSRPKEKQDTYEVMEKDSFYKKGEIGKSHHKKQKHLEHRLNKL